MPPIHEFNQSCSQRFVLDNSCNHYHSTDFLDEVADYFDRYDLYSNFIVAVSTSNIANIDVSVVASEQTEFYAEAEETYSITISPSQPQYVYYKFTENDTDTVLIEIDSEDDVCLTVSVQDSSVRNCP